MDKNLGTKLLIIHSELEMDKVSYNPPSSEEIKLLNYAEQRQQQGLDLIGGMSPSSSSSKMPGAAAVAAASSNHHINNTVSKRGRPPKARTAVDNTRIEQLIQHQVRTVVLTELFFLENMLMFSGL